MRCGTVTHNFNPDQRHITLEFKSGKGDVILARMPTEPNVAIVGYYLLFVIDSTGRPSTGRFIQICQGQRAAAAAVAGPGLVGAGCASSCATADRLLARRRCAQPAATL